LSTVHFGIILQVFVVLSQTFQASQLHKHFLTHQITLHNFQVTYNFQSSFISTQETSILLVKLEIFTQVTLSKTSPEFLFIVIALIKLAKYIQLKNIARIKISFFIN
jgi:hypothetical protein